MIRQLKNAWQQPIVDAIISFVANTWGYSSAGRALAWHARGQEFDPPYLHHKKCDNHAVCELRGYFYMHHERWRELWSKYGRNIIGLTVRGGKPVRIDTNIGIVIASVGSRRRQFFTSSRWEINEVVSGKSFFTMTKTLTTYTADILSKWGNRINKGFVRSSAFLRWGIGLFMI